MQFYPIAYSNLPRTGRGFTQLSRDFSRPDHKGITRVRHAMRGEGCNAAKKRSCTSVRARFLPRPRRRNGGSKFICNDEWFLAKRCGWHGRLLAPSFTSCAVACLLHVRKKERGSWVGKMSLLILLSAQERRANEPAQNFLPCGGGGGVILLLQEGIQLPRRTFVA